VVALLDLDDQYLPWYLEHAGIPWERAAPDELWRRASAARAQGRAVLSTAPSAEHPERWRLHARVLREGSVDLVAPAEIAWFRLEDATGR
jgi:hypothetical protein